MLLAPVVVASTSVKTAVALSVTLAIVTIPTMFIASFIKNAIPKWLRIPVYSLIASLLLIPSALIVSPISPTIFDSMGMYFSLMVFNSVLFSRCEKIAVKKSHLEVVADGAIYCIGFAVAILLISAVRELLYANTLWGLPVPLPFKISAAVLPFAGFMLVGMFSAICSFLREFIRKLVEKHRMRAKQSAMALVGEEVTR